MQVTSRILMSVRGTYRVIKVNRLKYLWIYISYSMKTHLIRSDIQQLHLNMS